MSVFSGPQAPGAMRLHREAKKAAALERSRRPRGRCRATGKRIVLTEEEAQAELVGMIMRANAGNGKRRECRTYQCPECGFWHFTSHPTPKEQNRS